MGKLQAVTRAAAYLRVSTDKQDLEVQLTEIRQHAVRRGWELVEAYSDIASGARDDRVDFRGLLADATKRKFDVIVVQRFDRAARSVKQLVQALEHLRRCRVAFLSIKEDIDTSTPAGEFIFHVMAAIGQFERALIGDRIRSGLDRARALGKSLGRPRAQVCRDQVLKGVELSGGCVPPPHLSGVGASADQGHVLRRARKAFRNLARGFGNSPKPRYYP